MEYGKEDLLKLENIGYKVIKNEGLPVPTEIKFRNSLGGTSRRLGTCVRSRKDGSFKIRVNLVTAKYFEDPNGRLIDKEGKKYRRAIIGNKVPFDELKATLAHEIAHLKIWNHPPEHEPYTQHILGEINKEYEIKIFSELNEKLKEGETSGNC